MRITLVVVGKLKEHYWRDAAQEYLKRLGPYATVEIIEIPDRDVTRDEARALAEEGEGIIRALPANTRAIALGIGGKVRSSEDFSGYISSLMTEGTSSLSFVIGGAAGLSEAVIRRVDESMSLGPMTLPHQLARVVVLEQIYRAFKIMRNEPYHR